MTSGSPGRRYKLRIDLTDFENETRFAEYSEFTVASAADYYRLQLGTYDGNAGLLIIYYGSTGVLFDQTFLGSPKLVI